MMMMVMMMIIIITQIAMRIREPKHMNHVLSDRIILYMRHVVEQHILCHRSRVLRERGQCVTFGRWPAAVNKPWIITDVDVY